MYVTITDGLSKPVATNAASYGSLPDYGHKGPEFASSSEHGLKVDENDIENSHKKDSHGSSSHDAGKGISSSTSSQSDPHGSDLDHGGQIQGQESTEPIRVGLNGGQSDDHHAGSYSNSHDNNSHSNGSNDRTNNGVHQPEYDGSHPRLSSNGGFNSHHSNSDHLGGHNSHGKISQDDGSAEYSVYGGAHHGASHGNSTNTRVRTGVLSTLLSSSSFSKPSQDSTSSSDHQQDSSSTAF